MKPYIISIEEKLTSYEFYNTLLKKLHGYYLDDGKAPLIFDFSNLKMIEALVIPNLLCVGYVLRKNSGIVPSIFIPQNLDAVLLKRYLNEINFISLSEKFGLFEFNQDIRDGWIGKGMDKLNTTVVFERDESEKETYLKITDCLDQFANKYLYDFNMNDDEIQLNNMMKEICKEIVDNSKHHGQSFAFMTIQYNYRREKAYISISDCGIGFKASINKKKSNIDKKIDDELEAILHGVYARVKSKVYGLLNVVKKTISKNGVVRIHSMETQLIITDRFSPYLEKSNYENMLELIKSNDFKPNIKRNIKYGGVHIEIELPLPKNRVASRKERGIENDRIW